MNKQILPDRAFAHFWGGLRQLVGVAVVSEGHVGVGRPGAAHLSRDAATRAGCVGLRAGGVCRVTGVRETLQLSSVVMSLMVVVQDS